MSSGSSAATSIQQAREGLRQARDLLIEPRAETVARCGPILEQAAGCLGVVEAALRSPASLSEEARRRIGWELAALRREMGLVRGLLDQAAQFYLSWGQWLAAAATGSAYTGQGDGMPLPALSRLTVRG